MRTTPRKHNVDLQLKERSSFCSFYKLCSTFRLGLTHSDVRLIGKRVVDFILVSIELFSLWITAETLRANMGSKSASLLQRGPVDPKFQVEGVISHQPFIFENQAK